MCYRVECGYKFLKRKSILSCKILHFGKLFKTAVGSAARRSLSETWLNTTTLIGKVTVASFLRVCRPRLGFPLLAWVRLTRGFAVTIAHACRPPRIRLLFVYFKSHAPTRPSTGRKYSGRRIIAQRVPP